MPLFFFCMFSFCACSFTYDVVKRWCELVSRLVTPPLSLSALTAEQYQQHQEQLALMQKQQLEQIQLQQQANSTATANSTQVGIRLDGAQQCTARFSVFILSVLSLTPSPLLLTGPGEYSGPGHRSVRRLGPRHRRPTAGSEIQGGASPGRWSQWRPLPLRYGHAPT